MREREGGSGTSARIHQRSGYPPKFGTSRPRNRRRSASLRGRIIPGTGRSVPNNPWHAHLHRVEENEAINTAFTRRSTCTDPAVPRTEHGWEGDTGINSWPSASTSGTRGRFARYKWTPPTSRATAKLRNYGTKWSRCRSCRQCHRHRRRHRRTRCRRQWQAAKERERA